jgi:CheY-like chemotaxis protein/anti-sigma regulatory factor (Ser/Thr protein kinase)
MVSLPDGDIVLDADLARLAQVFSNLLANSAKYTEPGGRIWVEARCGGGQVTVAVRDTGMGVPREELPRIFDMFSQVDRGTGRTTGGLGIGLTLVKQLVEKHGGTVEAHSDGPGTGSTFTVRLPVAAGGARAAAPAAAARARPGGAGAGRRILVVDDNVDAASSMQLMLAMLGNEVRTAHDGPRALQAARRFRPAVVFMDVGMPGMDGLEATRQIRRQPWGRDMIIVALTGWGQERDRASSQEAGCDGHLVKPVDPASLEPLLATLERSGRGEARGPSGSGAGGPAPRPRRRRRPSASV